MHVELTNTAPAEGFPRYVIGNRVGLPDGTSRLYVSFYSPLGADGVTRRRRADRASTVGTGAGWNVYSGFVDIPPGGTVDVEVQLAGVVQSRRRS